MADEKDPKPEREKDTVELAEGLRKGLDIVDGSTPPVDQLRPNLDSPPQAAVQDGISDDGAIKDSGADDSAPE